MDLRQHDVGLGLGEEAAAALPAFHRRQLAGIAQNQHRRAEGEEVAAELLVDHGAFVDDDELAPSATGLARFSEKAGCSSPVSFSGFSPRGR